MMAKEIVHIENTTSVDFKNEIVSELKEVFVAFAKQLQNTDRDELLTREETAKLLKISLVSLWDWTRKDLIPAYRIGNKVRYKKSEVFFALQQMNRFEEL